MDEQDMMQWLHKINKSHVVERWRDMMLYVSNPDGTFAQWLRDAYPLLYVQYRIEQKQAARRLTR